MTIRIQTPLHAGSTGLLVDIECRLTNGLPGMTVVGLGSKAVDEARERVRNAFASSQLAMPRKRITINLAPADVPKESTSLDLAIAVAILQADGQIKQVPDAAGIIGELGLDGTVRPVRGIIGKLLIGQRHGLKTFFIPEGNMAQAQLVPHITLAPLRSLQELFASLTGTKALQPVQTNEGYELPQSSASNDSHQLSDIVGQAHAKRALEIAAAGGHNILLQGPPGTGKSMLARALPSLLPQLAREEMLEVTQLHSLVGGSYDELIATRPFRAPHHSASHVAVVGGGNNLRPGEISLAHRGVLFFDEFPEFGRATIEALRQPLEDRAITVVRAKESATFPANFILVATANPCPCGFFGTPKPCVCSASAILRYRQKLSGPIMDRIDLYANVQEVDHELLLADSTDTSDSTMRSRITRARAQQKARFGSSTRLNSDMTNKDIKTTSSISPKAQELLNQAAKHLSLSPRSYMRVIKVARTIADLDKLPNIEVTHVSEALQYRAQPASALD